MKHHAANANQFQLDVILSFFMATHLLVVDIAGYLFN